MSVINSQPLIGASGNQGYFLEKSLRFRSSASAYISRTLTTPTNSQKWTFSDWIKRGSLASNQFILQAGNSVNDEAQWYFTTSDTIRFYQYTGSYQYDFTTAQVFRDPSAWYHIVVQYDSTQATAANRFRVYVNGSQITLTASTNVSLNATDSKVNSAVSHDIGGSNIESRWFDGYMTEINFIDGQALTPSSFGETSPSTGVWIPKKYSGTYGTNGFYLDFKDTSSTTALGYDAAGSNDWTVNNISLTSGSTYDSMTDVPTLTSATAANYCVLNPLHNAGTLSNANLTWSGSNQSTHGTIAVNSGKFYFEIKVDTYSSGTGYIGLSDDSWTGVDGSWSFSQTFVYITDGRSGGNGTSKSYGATYTAGDTIGIAFDVTGNTIEFFKNNTSQGVAYTTGLSGKNWRPFLYFSASSAITANFGQRPFAYTPPTGFNRLNTFNLPTPTIGATASTTANKYFGINLWTGNGSTGSRAITGLGFKPDWVWWKNRTTAKWHQVFDSNRGADKALSTNATDAEDASGGYGGEGSVTSFDTDGYTLQGGVGNNENNSAIVGWAWQAGQGTNVTNTAGSITSTVSANTSAGFSIVTYTGSGAAGTVGHGLGVAPSMIITKKRSNAGGGSAATNWVAWHKSLSGAYNSTTGYIYFNDTAAGATTTNFYDGTAMTSTTFRWQTGNDNINYSNDTYVAYCFAEVAGYSKFGSYTGNGSYDGTFVYTGFRPKFVIVKRIDGGAEGWLIDNSACSPYNAISNWLYANNSNAEGSGVDHMDFLSNGFKNRFNGADTNSNGGTYIYMAFAENPFKYSLAR